MKKWILIILGLIGLDQLTKYLVMTNMVENIDVIEIIPGVLAFQYVRNSGGVFGFGQGTSHEMPWLFIVFIVIAVAIFAYIFSKTDFKDKKLFWFRLATALLIAGALGNGIDRVIQDQHEVVDFIYFTALPENIWSYIFNVADMYLVVGIGIFIVDTFFLEPKRRKVTNG